MNPARLVYPGFWFGKTSIDDACKLAEMGVGGFCVYGGTAKEIESFSQKMRDLSPYNKILIAADYEDGLGRWVEGTELLPSNMAIGASGDEDLALKKGLITARQARSIGVDWIFAPVVDVACSADNPIVNTRAFGCDASLVSKLAMSYIVGLSQGGVLNSLKHFPGHGATNTDSHLALPFINKTFDNLFDEDLLPYRTLLRFADSIMVGHLLIPVLDTEEPSSLSEKTIKGLLRQRLNYKGCVITDALLMKAIGDQKAMVGKALKAGVDILLAPADSFATIEEINRLQKEDYRWTNIFINAVATQEIMLTKNLHVEVRAPEHALTKTSYSMDAAPACITNVGAKTHFKKGDKVYYLDVDSPPNFNSLPFVEALEEEGIILLPYKSGKVDNLLVISFNGYASFKGSINLTEEQKKEIAGAVSHAKNAVMVSFGSPFVHTDFLEKIASHYLAYCLNEDFQIFLARVLAGKKTVHGKLPVKLKK